MNIIKEDMKCIHKHFSREGEIFEFNSIELPPENKFYLVYKMTSELRTKLTRIK